MRLHLREEFAARRKYLDAWEKQDPNELYSPSGFLLDIRANLIDAAKAEIKVMEQAIDLCRDEIPTALEQSWLSGRADAAVEA